MRVILRAILLLCYFSFSSPSVFSKEGAYIVTIGPELASHGSETLQEAVVTFKKKYGYENTIDLKISDLMTSSFPPPHFDDNVYLLAHGDEPLFPELKHPNLGEHSARDIHEILRKIFMSFMKYEKTNKFYGQKFRGRIILEGCHTGVRLHDSSKVLGSSLLDEVQTLIQKDKFFKKVFAPETRIAGYRGSSYSIINDSPYGNASIESFYERSFFNKEHSYNKVYSENDIVRGFDAVIERQWLKKIKY